ncbi:hypothetical protein FBEOM_10298 [Fusarium beomiforme]|uniref:Uncharacterized protein n=1 Tax=Fusarium beomiforme TaxID=44412 RepID=A0A9P5ACR7_9HYPO|nr:hypothetical protein FBEOM_10298 [Fusarium beomiforme]
MAMTSGREPPDNLADLASLCLCGYHLNQVNEVVDRWTLTIINAVDHHENLMRSELSTIVLNLENQFLRTSLRTEQETAEHQYIVSMSWKQKYESSEKELKLKKESEAKCTAKLQNMQARNTAMQPLLKDAQQKNQDNKVYISKLESEKKRLEIKAQESTTQLDVLKKELCEAKEAVRDLNGLIENLQNAAEVSTRDVEKLQAALAEPKESNRIMAVELETKTHILRDRDTDLEQKKAQIHQLDNAVSTLKITEASLKESIGKCWLHRLSSWFKRLIGNFSLGKSENLGYEIV